MSSIISRGSSFTTTDLQNTVGLKSLSASVFEPATMMWFSGIQKKAEK